MTPAVWQPHGQRNALILRFGVLSEAPGDQSSQLDRIVWLIGWLGRTPGVTEPMYRAELARVLREGAMREPVRFGIDNVHLA